MAWRQKLSLCPSHAEPKPPRCRIHHTLLQVPELDLKHLIELRALERMKQHHLVQGNLVTNHNLLKEKGLTAIAATGFSTIGEIPGGIIGGSLLDEET